MRVSYKIMSPVPLFPNGSQKTHMQIMMFMTAVKAFFEFSYSIGDEQNGKGLNLVFK